MASQILALLWEKEVKSGAAERTWNIPRQRTGNQHQCWPVSPSTSSKPHQKPWPILQPTFCTVTTCLTPGDTIPPQPLVTAQSSALITSYMAQSMMQGQHNMAGPGVSSRDIDHHSKASHWLFWHVYNKSPRLRNVTPVKWTSYIKLGSLTVASINVNQKPFSSFKIILGLMMRPYFIKNTLHI